MPTNEENRAVNEILRKARERTGEVPISDGLDAHQNSEVDEILKRVKTQAAADGGYADSYFAQATSGINEGLGNLIGLPVDMANTIVDLGVRGLNAVAGTELRASSRPFGGSAQLKETMADIGSIHPETEDRGKQFVRRVGQEGGAMLVPGLAGVRKAKDAAMLAASALSSGTGGAIANQIFPDNPYADAVGSILGASVPSAVSAARRWPRTLAGIPSRQNLFAKADALYNRAERFGVTANRSVTRRLAADMRQIAKDEGLISPSGRVSSAYPKITDALNTFDDYAQGTMSVKQMKIVKKTLANAAGSSDRSERRIAMLMFDKFYEATSPLAPEIAKANKFYHSGWKARALEKLDERVKAKSSYFTGSGPENARRNEYRNFGLKITDEKIKGYTPAEHAAIKRVAEGTIPANAARYIGKLAPTGVVSFGMGSGVPFMIANEMLGPAAGTMAGLAAPAAGAAGRIAANNIGRRSAEYASALVRSMGPIKKAPIISDEIRNVWLALLAARAASLPE